MNDVKRMAINLGVEVSIESDGVIYLDAPKGSVFGDNALHRIYAQDDIEAIRRLGWGLMKCNQVGCDMCKPKDEVLEQEYVIKTMTRTGVLYFCGGRNPDSFTEFWTANISKAWHLTWTQVREVMNGLGGNNDFQIQLVDIIKSARHPIRKLYRL